MAFDFSMFNKPCAFINYDQQNQAVKDWSVKNIYQFQHFSSMPNKDAVIWLNSKEEIIEKLTLKKEISPEMLKWKETVLGDYKNASLKIKKKLKID